MRVLISGASIAGPALAFWLHRYGIEATLVERAPAPRPGGQAVDLRGVGKVAADRMGLLEQIRAACTDTGGLSLVDASGRRRATLTVDQFGGDGPIAEIEILRGDIARVLREATDNEYLYGDRIVLLDEQSDGVHVTFESGGCRVFDAVIGADGLHSGVRSLLFGDVPLRHLGRYLAFWTARNHLGLENWSLVHNAPGRSIGVRTINSNQAFMAFASFHADDLHHDYRDIGWQKSLVRSRLSGLGWEAAELVSQLDDAADFYFDSVSQVHLPSWSRGRVGLLGDAAFCASPSSGQGTSLALVGGYVLAGELAAAPDVPAALAAYENRLRPWVLANQKMGRTNARAGSPSSALGVRLQQVGMRLLPHLPERLLFGSMLAVLNGFDLPDYSRYLTSVA
ncbi:FAD-dependent monooxygenase [Amycolatopsis sp. NPDC050768]|uniref:FAD-dependent monooxygenase n=1 Tax=Amycolatopsis sp. NPDC050768 TaxID=3154839 RepID=UPI0033F8A28B